MQNGIRTGVWWNEFQFSEPKMKVDYGKFCFPALGSLPLPFSKFFFLHMLCKELLAMADPDQITRDVDVMQLQQVRNCSYFVAITQIFCMLLHWRVPSHIKSEREKLPAINRCYRRYRSLLCLLKKWTGVVQTFGLSTFDCNSFAYSIYCIVRMLPCGLLLGFCTLG